MNADYFWLNGNTLTMLAFQKFALSGRRCYWTGLGRGLTDPDAAWHSLLYFDSPFLVSPDYGNPRNQISHDLEYTVGLNYVLTSGYDRVDAAVYRRALRSGRYEIVPGSRRLGVVLLRRTQS